MRKKGLILLGLLVSLTFFAPQAHAFTLLFADDFESGLSEWDTSFLNIGTSSLASKPGFGKHGFLTGYIFNRHAYMFTTVTTTGYEDIVLNFWANSNYMDDSSDKFYWGYSTDGNNWVKSELDTNGWEEYSFLLPEATGDLDDLYIGFELKSTGNWKDVDFGKVDNLSVTGENGATPVPEPTTLLLFSSGLAGAFIRKKMRG